MSVTAIQTRSGKADRRHVWSSLTIPADPIEKFWFFRDDCFGEFAFHHNTVHEHTIETPKVNERWKSLRECGFDMVDAALTHPEKPDEAFFFLGEYCALINVRGQRTGEDFVVDGPKRIGEFFPSLERAGFTTVDAVYHVPRAKRLHAFYAFKGRRYTRLHFPDDGNFEEPKNIDVRWPSLKKAGFTELDTVIPVPPTKGGEHTGSAYYFSGEHWVRIHLDADLKDTIQHGPFTVVGDNDNQHWVALTKVKFYP